MQHEKIEVFDSTKMEESEVGKTEKRRWEEEKTSESIKEKRIYNQLSRQVHLDMIDR